jgi:hypothetical protein
MTTKDVDLCASFATVLPSEPSSDHFWLVLTAHSLPLQIPWKPFLQSILNQTLSPNETIIVLDLKYLANLNNIISSIDPRYDIPLSFSVLSTFQATLFRGTPCRTLANYMLWRVVYDSMSLLSRKYRDLMHDYNRYFTGQDREEARWKVCVDLVSQQMNIATSSMYVRHYFRESSKNKVSSDSWPFLVRHQLQAFLLPVKTQEIVRYLINEFVHTLEHVNWMDEKTRENAVDKAKTMKTYIGYTDEMRNGTLINELYEEVRIRLVCPFKCSHDDSTLSSRLTICDFCALVLLQLELSANDFYTNLLLIRRFDSESAYADLRENNVRGE